ncbi:MAG: type I restriction enzyme HsdR N-terminal domain-containing protein [Kiritimatiellia bacterium]
MSSIPKKVTERFIRAIPKFQRVIQIAKDRDVNESDTVSVLNDILGEVFGFEKYLEVTSEMAIRGTFCDLALKVDGKVQFLIEAKAVGISLKEAHMKQACDYGANNGVQWIVLTNSIEWRVYRIRFEQPINYDLVCSFDFMALNPKDEKDLDILFLLAKEGLAKSAREDFYEKVQSVNRYVIGQLVLSEPVLDSIRRELKKLSDGMKIENDEIGVILQAEVIKREVVEGDQADAARARVNKFYRKNATPRKPKAEAVVVDPAPANESMSEKLLREVQHSAIPDRQGDGGGNAAPSQPSV